MLINFEGQVGTGSFFCSLATRHPQLFFEGGRFWLPIPTRGITLRKYQGDLLYRESENALSIDPGIFFLGGGGVRKGWFRVTQRIIFTVYFYLTFFHLGFLTLTTFSVNFVSLSTKLPFEHNRCFLHVDILKINTE